MGERITETIERISVVEGAQGREWDILIIKPGVSKNGVWYEPNVLKEAAARYEGAWSYDKHSDQPRSFRERIGRVHSVAYEAREGEEGLWGRLRVIDASIRDKLLEAHEAGELHTVGFSHDVTAVAEAMQYQGRRVRKAKHIEAVNSVDMVERPSAGGRMSRLVAGEEEDVSVTLEEIRALLAEERAALKEEIKTELAPAPAKVTEEHEPEPTPAEVKAANDAAHAALRESTKERQRGMLNRLLEATKLSTPGKALLGSRIEEALSRKVMEDSEIQTLVTQAVEYEALFTEQSRVPANGIGITFETGTTGKEKFIEDLKAMFLTPQDKLAVGVRPFTSFKEAYVKYTGKWDADLETMMEDYIVPRGYSSNRDHGRIQESLSTASWGQIFADVMYQMLMNAYVNAPWYDQWRIFCSAIENVPDFRTRHWMRIGGYGDLPAVAEGATYQTTTSPTDEEATYAPSKRGFLDDITMESIINDQVNSVTRLVREMGRAAARTLYKFVLNMVTVDNGNTTYDSTAFYVAGHGNTGTTALSISGLYSTQQLMYDQTAYNQSLEILGDRNRIKHLIVPNELTGRAERILNPSDAYLFNFSSTPDTDTSLDPQQFKGSGIQVHTYHQLTDATDWWAVADPNQVDTMVMGFLGGRQEPEFFTQDQPQNGSVFSADKISYKTRFIFGGAILEHRSFFRQVVAG